MYPSLRLLTLGAVLVTVPSAAKAQAKWVGHEDPCDLDAGHYLVRGSMQYMQQAVETRFPDQRDSRLAEAHRVLTEAVTSAGRETDAAVWYYFGRYYVEKNDPAGADSAFRRAEALAPSCASDIARHRQRVGPLALNEGLRTWGQQHLDSAATHFRLARRLMPGNAEVPLYLSIMYAGAGQLDSAGKYLHEGLEQAGTDEAYAVRRKEAMKQLAQAHEARAYQDQTVIRGPQARITRDTIQPTIDRDSTAFAQMVGRVQDIRAGGRQLDPQSLQAFQQESTTVAGRLASARMTRDSVHRQAAADSQAAAVVLDPAITAYAAFLDAYPDDGESVMKLARLYSAAGRRTALAGLIERVTTSDAVSATDMVQGALTLSNDGQDAAAERLLDAALARNPYDYNALYVLARILYTRRDTARLPEIARRLRTIDPLSQNAMRTTAMAFDAAGQRDSVQHYLARADTGIGWNVNVTQFTPRDSSTALSGAVSNVARRPLPPVTLVFEFLDAGGQVLFSETVEVPALEPRGRERISVRPDRGGAVAWRYRRR